MIYIYYGYGSVGGISPNAQEVKNSYSSGKFYNINYDYIISFISTISSPQENISNSYYLYDINDLDCYSGKNTGVQVTKDELSSREFFDKLNVDNVWLFRENESPVLKMPATNAKEITELNVKNKSKEFKIFTHVEMLNGVKGGSISGEEETPYEKVEYNKDSTKEIQIIPDEGFKILKITINGKKIDFNPEQNGTYKLPQFEKMSEDKYIVVSFAKIEQTLTINKIDKDTREHLSGAEFKIALRNKEITNKLSQSYSRYYLPFNEETTQYISNNKNVRNSIAQSYVNLGSLVKGKYYIEIDAKVSSEEGKDIGYATISKEYASSSHGNNDNIIEFMNISGEVESKTYKSEIFESDGDTNWYLNVLYSKDGQNSAGEDALFINSIKLYYDGSEGITEITNSNGQINVALEQGDYEITETKAPEGYMLNQEPIEFTFDSNNKTLTIENESKAKISVNHYLWTETDGITTQKVADSEKYFGDLGKDYSTSPNFKIEYEIVRNKDFYRGKTESEILSLLKVSTIQEVGYSSWDEFNDDYYIPTNASGKYTDTTQVVDYYYKEKTYTLTIKHLLEGTEQNVPSKTGELVEDEITEGLEKDEDYTTEKSNKIDYTKYELIDKSDNYKGKIEDDTEVRYYYRLKDSAGVIVHHYIVGTENKVPSNTDGVVEDESLPQNGTAKVGDEYETSNASSRIAQNYRVATNKDVYGNNMPQELVGKETEVYTPTNATGKYKENVQEVTYYYILETPEYTNTISKTGTENIVKEDEKVNYNITYNVQVQDYIGNATVQIVDNLPYKIDVSKSSLNGGEYNEANKTITWKDMIRNIDTYNNPSSGNITISKAISVVYKNLDYSKNIMTNRVSGSTKLLASNVTTDVVQAEANTNYHFYKDITLNKVWQDNDDSLGLRPDSINVTLKATTEGENSTQVEYSIPDTIQKNVTLKNTTGQTNGENWTYKWQNLDKYSSEGKLINYTIEENLEGNLANVYNGTLEEQNNVFTLTNKYEEPTEKIDLIVNKIWEDNNNENEKRPDNIKIVVSKPTTTGEGVEKVQEYTLNTSTETSHTFTNLLKYDEKGNKINYVVEEDEVNENDLQFYNSLIGNIEEKEIGGKQVYETTITNCFQVSDEKVNVAVTKDWEDNNNENEKRPDNIKIVVSKPKTTGEGVEMVQEYILNVAENEESHTFTDLPRYDEKGNEIIYTITEEEVNEGDLKFYTKQIEEVSKNNFKITNTFTIPSEQISITAKKVWDDNENAAEKRPASVTIKLMNGSQEVATDIANLENNWQVTFSNLAKYDSKGKEIDYKVKEQETNQNDLYFYKPSVIKGNKEDGFEIKNTFEVPDDKIQIPVTKTWNDGNKDRLSSVVMVLTGNGKTYTQTITSSNKSSSNSNIWNYTFKNLPKYDSNGNEITYKLSEKEANKGDLNKYITTIDGYNATNTLIVKDTKIEKEGTEKITSLDDKIAYSLKYTINLNEEYKDEAKVTIIDTLPYEIDTSKDYNLDGGVYDRKKKTITWTSQYNNEMAITKNISLVYKDIDVTKTKITNNVKGIFELENGYKEEKTASFDTKTDFTTSVEVNKVWVGDSKINTDGTITISSSRPNKATIELNTLDENNKLTKIDKKDLASNNNWQITFKNLPKYDTKTGKEIIYKVTENNIPKGYYNSIKQENNVFTITNSKYGSITITKVDSGDSSKKLGGAEFKLEKLKEVNGKMEVDKSFTTKTATTSSKEATLGKLQFKNLEYGTYKLTETKAPEGYSLSKNPTQIEITSEKPDYVGELSNKVKMTLPLTGGVGRNILIVVGAFFLIVLFIIKKKRI